MSLLSISDAFVYLTFQRLSDLNVRFFPLLYLGTALIYLILAIPLGRLADQVGRWLVFLTGYVGLLGTYAILLLPQLELFALLACLILFGIYYAASEGVLMAVASETLATSAADQWAGAPYHRDHPVTSGRVRPVWSTLELARVPV